MKTTKYQKDGNFLPIYLVGPTAVGKTSVAMDLAEKINAEILVADSMQIYRELDIGTAKPSLEERRRVPHHMLDLVDPLTEFDVAQFVGVAQGILKEIQSRWHVPLVVGGTGLYLKALIDGIFEGPSKNNQIRERLEEEAKNSGWQVLYERLKNVDSLAASRIDPKNVRRIIRALEVYEMTGSPISEFRKQWDFPQSQVCLIGLDREREYLYQRIDERVEEMFERGLIAEVEKLFSQGIEQNHVVMQAIGYKEGISYLKGKCTLNELKDEIKKKSRHLAKRQMTWFKKDLRIHWFKFQPDEGYSEMAQRIFEFLYSRS
jgi:tRNA dimethylallyltransferase